MSCVSTVRYKLLLNGSLCKDFTPARGVRQGDPLSSYLFILCAEILSRMLVKEEAINNIQGIKVSREAPAISHLLYADDIIIVCRANESNAKIVQRTLELFTTNQQGKISIFFSKNTKRRVKAAVKEIFGFKEFGTSAIYLGNNLIFGRKRSKEFGRLKEKIQHRLEGWQSSLLSRAGKATLIKSIVQAIPTYSMSTFRLPLGVGTELDAIIRKFWWGAKKDRYLALKSWNTLCQPREFGGIGFRLSKEFNTALLAKLGWLIATGKRSLWTDILRARYLKNESIF